MNFEIMLDALVKFHRWCQVLEYHLEVDFRKVWEKMTLDEKISMYLTFNHN